MNQLTRLAIQGYLNGCKDRHPSTVLAIPFTVSEWEAILKGESNESDQRDAERLDELERSKCYPFWNGDGWTYIVAAERSSKIDRKGIGKTVREAIDAAMLSSSSEGKA